MTTDTIPEATREFAKSLWGGRNIGDEAYFVERVLTHFATLQKQCSSLETALADWHKMADQRSEALIKAQQQCEELRRSNDNWQAVVKDDCENEQEVRNLCKPYVQEVEDDGYGVIPVQNVVEKAFESLTKERDDLRTRLAELEKAEQQFEEAAKISHEFRNRLKERSETSEFYIQQFSKNEKEIFQLSTDKRAVQDQLTRLQQDVKPLVDYLTDFADRQDGAPDASPIDKEACNASLVIETFLTAHPECKP